MIRFKMTQPIKTVLKTIFFLLFSFVAYSHPYHHSLTILDYNYQSQQFEVSLKLLTEDYKKITPFTDIKKHIRNNLKISNQNKFYQINFQGEQIETENSWIYFTIDAKCHALKQSKQITVTNTLLLTTNPNQFNTLKINNGNKHLTHNFSKSQKEHTYTFETFNC